jgi:hypothetical protein
VTNAEEKVLAYEDEIDPGLPLLIGLEINRVRVFK